MPTKRELLTTPIQHIDIKQHNVVALVDAMQSMAYQPRDLARAAEIYDRMLRDQDCGVILCLAGSLISAGPQAGLCRHDPQQHGRRDRFSTGANIVDQDFFEALGFRHYMPRSCSRAALYDAELRELTIDRIYDTLIDEEELRICDETTHQIANALVPVLQLPRIHSRDGRLPGRTGQDAGEGRRDSIVLAAYEKDVPIFCPAFSDCSAGFGLVAHQHAAVRISPKYPSTRRRTSTSSRS